MFLAAISRLGTAVEGACYAAAQRPRPTEPAVDQLADSDRTTQLQSAVADALRGSLPGNLRWKANSLSQFARLMRDIRNYRVHPGSRPTAASRSNSPKTNAGCSSSKHTTISSAWPRSPPRPRASLNAP